MEPPPLPPMCSSARGSENNLLPPAAVSYFPLIQYHSSAHKSGKGEILITEETSVIAPIKEVLAPLQELVPIDDPVPYDVSLEDEILSPEPPEIAASSELSESEYETEEESESELTEIEAESVKEEIQLISPKASEIS